MQRIGYRAARGVRDSVVSKVMVILNSTEDAPDPSPPLSLAAANLEVDVKNLGLACPLG